MAISKDKSDAPKNTETASENTNTENNAAPVKADGKILEKLRNVTVTASEDGGTVTLSGGEADFSIEGSNKKGSVALGGSAAEIKIGSRTDIISFITVNPGNGQYLVLFEDKGNTPIQKSLVFLGNNVTVSEIITAPLGGGKGGPEYAISVKGVEKGFETTFIYSVVNGEIDAGKAIKI
jgi:hypothetical protein